MYFKHGTLLGWSSINSQIRAGFFKLTWNASHHFEPRGAILKVEQGGIRWTLEEESRTPPQLPYLQVDWPLHWPRNFNSPLSSFCHSFHYQRSPTHWVLSLMSSIPSLQKTMPSLQVEEFDLLTTQLFHSFVHNYKSKVLPVVELSFPSSNKSSQTLLQGVWASNEVFVVTVMVLFPALLKKKKF